MVKIKAMVRVMCHTCDGKLRVIEESWPDKKQIYVVCPECKGRGYVVCLKEETILEDELSFVDEAMKLLHEAKTFVDIAKKEASKYAKK